MKNFQNYLQSIILCYCCYLQCCSALKLNLTASCADKQIYFCTLRNISAHYEDPLVIVQAQSLQLSELIIRNSVIGMLPREIFMQAPHLRVFMMDNCALNRLHDYDFKQARELTTLVLQRNRLSTLPEQVFSEASTLERLHLGHNSIHMLHRKAFANLKLLKYLDLQLNAIHTLPAQLFDELNNLEHLDLGGNELEKIDAQTFAQNTKLQTLLLGSNRFSVFEANALEHLPHLHLLDISNNLVDEINLQSVDTLLAQNATLTQLSISGSCIKVHASNNQLQSLRIGDKLAMRELELRGNKFETLDDFNGMNNLQRLDISHNKVRTLSTSHSPLHLTLPNLLHLNAGYNQLTNLSFEHFLLLQKLTHLDMAFNHIQNLDANIFEPLLSLQKFYIEGNNLLAFDYESFFNTHPRLSEIGIVDGDNLNNDYVHNFVDSLQQRHIQLAVRFNGVFDSHTTAFAPSKSSAYTMHHHRYASTAFEATTASSAFTGHNQQARLEATGIHPYWTTRDVLAVATLSFVLLILLLQLYRILQEEQCFSWCHRRIVGFTTARSQRLDEEDSEV